MDEQTRDQRTEAPTPRRWQRALDEGQITISNELVGGSILLAGTLYFWVLGGWFFGSLADACRQRLTHFDPMIWQEHSLLPAIRSNVSQIGMVCVALLVPTYLAAVLAGTLQTRFNISFKPLGIQWNRIQLANGWRRIISWSGLVRGGLAVCKACAILVVAYYLVTNQIHSVIGSGQASIENAVIVGGQLTLQVALAIAAMIVLIGLVDLGFQKWRQFQDLKMSTQEVRDENKETEGDPLIRARVRRLRNEFGRQMMLQNVAHAKVVVTNPTHYAVALRYEPGETVAPVVVAKGRDHMAKRIIDLAKRNNVAVVERKSVARFLYANVKVGQMIPVELYQAVAEILNFIKRLGRAA
jgi:flagellar biosynthetic protein FlhB